MKKYLFCLALIAVASTTAISVSDFGYKGGGTSRGTADNRYVLKTGDTMTGTLTNDSIAYVNTAYPSLHTLKAAIDQLLYVSPEISGLTTNYSAGLEQGASATSTVLTWSLNKTMTFESFNNGIGSIAPTLETYTHTDTYTTARTYTLTANDGSTADTASTTVTFYWRKYYGVSSEATLDDAGIIGLATKPFATSRTTSFSSSPSGQYIYICYPASWGAATFTVNGLTNTDWTLAVQSHTNASGGTVNYNVYRTNNLLTGTYTISVL